MRKPAPVYSLEFVLHPERDAAYVHFEDAAGNPFEPDPAGVSRVNAWWLAEAALAAYWGPADGIAMFTAAGCDCEYLDDTPTSTECFLAWRDSWLLVAFRGTQSGQWKDVVTDAAAVLVPWPAGNVHAGFKRSLDAIWPALEARLDALSAGRTVWFCGHSLGAALATLAADRYPATRGVATFGSPRVGDFVFANAFSARFKGKSLRYVNDHDIVTHVPPPVGYKHVDARRTIAPDGTISPGPATIAHFFTDLFGDTRHLHELITALDAKTLSAAPAFLLDHMPKAYAIWTWNDFDAHG